MSKNIAKEVIDILIKDAGNTGISIEDLIKVLEVMRLKCIGADGKYIRNCGNTKCNEECPLWNMNNERGQYICELVNLLMTLYDKNRYKLLGYVYKKQEERGE